MNRNLLLVAISLFTWGVGEGLFIYFQPLYLQQWGADPLMIGAVLSAFKPKLCVCVRFHFRSLLPHFETIAARPNGLG